MILQGENVQKGDILWLHIHMISGWLPVRQPVVSVDKTSYRKNEIVVSYKGVSGIHIPLGNIYKIDVLNKANTKNITLFGENYRFGKDSIKIDGLNYLVNGIELNGYGEISLKINKTSIPIESLPQHNVSKVSDTSSTPTLLPGLYNRRLIQGSSGNLVGLNLGYYNQQTIATLEEALAFVKNLNDGKSAYRLSKVNKESMNIGMVHQYVIVPEIFRKFSITIPKGLSIEPGEYTGYGFANHKNSENLRNLIRTSYSPDNFLRLLRDAPPGPNFVGFYDWKVGWFYILVHQNNSFLQEIEPAMSKRTLAVTTKYNGLAGMNILLLDKLFRPEELRYLRKL